MLLFEGSDAVGKTTVASYLRQNMPSWAYISHRTPKMGVSAYEYHGATLNNSHPRIICDRLHWSEYVYGSVFRGKPDYTPHDWRLIELVCLTLGTRVVLMTDAYQGIRARWAVDKTQDYPVEQLSEVLAAYDRLALHQSEPFVTHLPIEKHTLPELLENGKPTVTLEGLIVRAQTDAQFAAWLLPPALGLGSRDARFAIIGEAPGHPLKTYRQAVPWDVGPSAEFLWNALDQLDCRWWQGYYTNASTFSNGSQLVHYLASQFTGLQRIVVLGQRALKAVVDGLQYMPKHIEIYHLTHPTHHASEREAWVADLYEAVGEWCLGDETMWSTESSQI